MVNIDIEIWMNVNMVIQMTSRYRFSYCFGIILGKVNEKRINSVVAKHLVSRNTWFSQFVCFLHTFFYCKNFSSSDDPKIFIENVFMFVLCKYPRNVEYIIIFSSKSIKKHRKKSTNWMMSFMTSIENCTTTTIKQLCAVLWGESEYAFLFLFLI